MLDPRARRRLQELLVVSARLRNDVRREEHWLAAFVKLLLLPSLAKRRSFSLAVA